MLPSIISGYQIQHRIGAGGMGEVYKAWHPELQRMAAVKVLHQKDQADRFQQEAFIQSQVDHPAIVKVFEYTKAGDTPCIIMEYVGGEPLDQVLQQKGKFTSGELIPILTQVIDALEYLHARDVLHRDIKPSNFRLLPDGSIKMLDFGIAKHKYSPRLTQQGFVVGTTEYMAPEQFDQQPDLPSDIWSLGVMTYELATGYLPFEATNPISLRARIGKASFTNPRVLVPDLDTRVVNLIDKCLRSNPGQRPKANQLKSILKNNLPVMKTRLIQTEKIPSIPKPFLGLGALVLGVFLLLLLWPKGEKIIQPDKPAILGGQTKKPEKNTRSITINVPGVQSALLIFPDGTQYPAPHVVHGEDGEPIKFRIEANGYYPKEVAFDLRMGPYTYDFVLEKINNEQ